MGQTETSVHSPAQMIAQRRTAALLDKSGLNALSVYAQLAIGFSLYLYEQVSTPGYLSTLLTLPVLLLLFLPGRFLASRKQPGLSVTVSAAGTGGARIFFLCFFLLHLLDAQLAFFTLCAVVRDVMPDFERTAVALAAALFCALGSGEDEGLNRLSRPLKWLIGALLLYCVLIAVPHGSAAHFFPLLGYGPASILRGTLWISGGLASAAWPMLTREDTEPPLRFFPTLRAPLLALVLGSITYLASVWLMPVYVMQRPESLGWRMLLLVHMTPSVPAWSMEVIGLMLLLLTATAYSASQASFALSQFGGQQKTPRFLTAALLFSLVPACVTDPDSVQEMLAAASPWRAAVSFMLLILLCLCSLIRNKKKADTEDFL